MTSCNIIYKYDVIFRQKSVLSKMFRIEVFQYKISDRMSYLTALYDNFLIFRKKNFKWGRIFKNRWAVREISTDFQSENGFKLTKDIVRGSKTIIKIMPLFFNFFSSTIKLSLSL